MQVASAASERGGPTVDTKDLNNPHPPHGVLLPPGPTVVPQVAKVGVNELYLPGPSICLEKKW